MVPGPAIGVDGSVLAASNGGVLHALDPATGADRWTVDGGGPYGSDLSTTPAVRADGTILWPAPRGRLVALTRDGRQRWSLDLGGFVLSPALVGDRAYVATMRGRLVALDVSGASPCTLWTLELGGTSYASPAVAPDGTIIAAHDAEAVAVRPDGSVRWRFRARDTLEVSPAAGPDGLVVLGTNGDDEIGLNGDGTERWRFAKHDWSYSSPVVHDDKAYFGDHGGYLDVVDARSGRLLARQLGQNKADGRTASGTGFWTAPLVDAVGDSYGGTASGHVYGFGPDGRRLWEADVGGVVSCYPALDAAGTLLIGSSDGTLHAFGDASPAG